MLWMNETTNYKSLGLSFGEIGKAIGKDEIWTAALFYGQVGVPFVVAFDDWICCYRQSQHHKTL
jgi:hypothetical protein